MQRALKISRTGSCSSTASRSRKAVGGSSYLPAGRKKFIRAHSLGDKFEKELVLATLKENAKSQPIILHSNLEEKPDRIKKLVDIQAKLKQGKGIGYERWAKKHNLKAMAQTLILCRRKVCSTRTHSTRELQSLTPSSMNRWP